MEIKCLAILSVEGRALILCLVSPKMSSISSYANQRFEVAFTYL